MKKKTYNLSIFLLKNSIQQEPNAVQDSVDLKKTTFNIKGKKICLYSKQNPAHPPSWINIFTPHTHDNLSHLLSSGCAAVLLVKRKGRYFALTFGYGRHLLQPDCFEENFGLKVVVNAVDPEKLRSIDAHTLESIPVHKRSQASVSTSFSEFGLDVEQDLMYAATGTAQDKEFCKTLSGKDALRVSLPFELNDIFSILDKANNLFKSNEYKKNFPWIDRLSEVRSSDLKTKLDEALIEKISRQDFSKTWLAVPEVINWENIAGFRYQKSKRGDLSEDISWDGFLTHLNSAGKSISLEALKDQYIHCIEASSDNAAYTWKVYKCVYCEINLGECSYSLTNGVWYKIDSDFLNDLDAEIGTIPISSLDLPQYMEKSEDKYNEKVVNENPDQFVLMDKKNLAYGGGRSKIEVCDIYSKDKKLIHVKRYGSSSVLSHLFAQGLVSIHIILSDGNFRALVNKKLPKTHQLPAKNIKPKASEFEVVYVIVSNDSKTSVLDLPLFSKINLRSCYKRIQLMDVPVSLCFVPVVK